MFEAFSEGGKRLFTDSGRGWAMTGKGVLTLSADTSGYGGSNYGYIPKNAEQELVFVVPKNKPITAANKVLSPDPGYYVLSDLTEVEWYRFSLLTSVPKNGVGLEIFGSDGTIQFSSSAPPLCLSGYAAIPDMTSSHSPPNVPAAVIAGLSGKHAACIFNPRAFGRSVAGGYEKLYCDGVLADSRGIVATPWNYFEWAATLYSHNYIGSFLLTVDITNL